MPVM
jgi:hypothetical protein